jgi:signal transduction histidine kinase
LRNTIRFRLTVLYTCLFLGCSAALLSITYTLVDRSAGPLVSTIFLHSGTGGNQGGTPTQTLPPAPLSQAYANAQHAAEMRQLLSYYAIAMAVMVVVSVVLGWLVAGRVLYPLRTITASVRDISASNLHERLVIAGPKDELAELSETFNELLDRLEAAFEAERLFVANASHELRTPLTRERTVMEVALRDKNATVDSLRTAGQRVLASGEQLERLIEALLTLARSQRGLELHEPLDLCDAAGKVLSAAGGALAVAADLRPAPATGDPRLAERLVGNLVDNALRHNVPDGHVEVVTGTQDGQAFIRVSNTGPQIPDEELARLLRPFQRLVPGRGAGRVPGSGLGLSIVHAITVAHGARCRLLARPGGGLIVEVWFPPVPPSRRLD